MEAVLIVLLTLLLLGSAAAMLTVFPTMWIGLRDQWRRTPRNARPRALASGGVALVLLLAAMIVAIAEPWGERSVLYVILIAGGATMVLTMAVVLIDAGRQIRRRRR